MRKVGISYRYMFLLSQLLELEYSQFLDSDFKSPVIHNKIRKMREAHGDIVKHLGVVLDGKDVESILEPTHYLNETVKILCSLEPNQIKEFSEGLNKLTA